MKKHKKYKVFAPLGYKFNDEKDNAMTCNAFELRRFAAEMIARDNEEWTDWDEGVWSDDIKGIVKMLRENGFVVVIEK